VFDVSYVVEVSPLPYGFKQFLVNGVAYPGTVSGSDVGLVVGPVLGNVSVEAVYEAALNVLTVTGPSSPQLSGASLTVSFSFINAGLGGVIRFTLMSGSTQVAVKDVTVNAGQTVTGEFTGVVMPDADTSFTVTGSTGGSGVRLVEVLRSRATNVSLTAPQSIYRGDAVTVSGKLLALDVPVGSAPISIVDVTGGSGSYGFKQFLVNGVAYPGTVSGSSVSLVVGPILGNVAVEAVYDAAVVVVGSGVTDAAGNYSITFNAPNTAGVYKYAAYYMGGVISGSISSIRRGR